MIDSTRCQTDFPFFPPSKSLFFLSFFLAFFFFFWRGKWCVFAVFRVWFVYVGGEERGMSRKESKEQSEEQKGIVLLWKK